MKLSSLLFMVTISLCASLCCPEENDFGPTIFIENENLIQVENSETTFNLNESIVIETTINNSQTTTSGETILLTDLFYNDSLEDAFLQFDVSLFKETGFGTLSPISLTQDAVTNDFGQVEVNSQFNLVRAFYDETTHSFRSRFSINLRESGTFFLANSRFGFNDFTQVIISGGVYELGFVELRTSIENANAEGAYEFQVIE
ncbi:hypothetical protein ACFQ1Q_01260 [Winogradskyella litorisediminis]|uniref:Uncharacterized protein n=1 Tax=Winogradskyella litorisediminis TaxID=1156618 RepID=A0ABW3N6J3_9FLAO